MLEHITGGEVSRPRQSKEGFEIYSHDEQGVLDTGGDEVDVTLKSSHQEHVRHIVHHDVGAAQLLYDLSCQYVLIAKGKGRGEWVCY